MSARITLADVAKACGVSKTAVTFALNRDAESCGLAVATRERIVAAAERLGYRPHWRGRALAKGRTQCIGLLYGGDKPLIGEFYAGMVEAMATTLSASDHDLTLIPALSGKRWADRLVDERLDAVVVMQPIPDGLGDLLPGLRIPAVLANLDPDLALPRVLPDDRGGAVALARHLHDLGHRRVAFFVGDLHPVPHYSEALRAAGLAEVFGEVAVVRTSAEAFAATIAGPSDRPTAVVGFSAHDAIRLLHAFTARGLCVPRDLSLAGFNNEFFTGLITPALTVAATPAHEIGRRCAELALALVAGEAPPTSPIRIPVPLIVRASTSTPPEKP